MKRKTGLWAYIVFLVLPFALTLNGCHFYTHVKENVLPPVKQIVVDSVPGMATALLEDAKDGLKWVLDKLGIPFEWTEEQVKSLTESATTEKPKPGA